jgi:hypothetical protein
MFPILFGTALRHLVSYLNKLSKSTCVRGPLNGKWWEARREVVRRAMEYLERRAENLACPRRSRFLRFRWPPIPPWQGGGATLECSIPYPRPALTLSSCPAKLSRLASLIALPGRELLPTPRRV